MVWQDKEEVKKGDIGEELVEKFLMKQGYALYDSIYKNSAHPCDRMAYSFKTHIITLLDVKTKPRRTYYPDTGINLNHFHVYNNLNKSNPFYLFFVDELSKEIYGNYLSVLAEERYITHNNKVLKYPLIQNNIIYFPLVAMKFVCKIDANTINSIKKHSTRNNDYNKEY